MKQKSVEKRKQIDQRKSRPGPTAPAGGTGMSQVAESTPRLNSHIVDRNTEAQIQKDMMERQKLISSHGLNIMAASLMPADQIDPNFLHSNHVQANNFESQ